MRLAKLVKLSERMTYLLEFRGENKFLGLFARGRIKTHFPLERPDAYFSQILFRWVTEVLTSRAMEKREVSYAKSLEIVERWSEMLLI